MLQSLRDSFGEPLGTKSAILLALKSPAGLRFSWIVVEAEEDEAVYKKFMHPDSTVVKTSVDCTGRKGYSNVETIVRDVKEEEPRTHILGIRDADYSRYVKRYVVPVNIFLTDRRDLEMTLLESESVKHALRTWAMNYDEAFAKCIPLCRYFGYLRIFNTVADLSVRFHDHLRTSKFWDHKQHSAVESWKLDCTNKFVALSDGKCSVSDVNAFISTNELNEEDFYDVCRGHDFVKLLSLALIDVQTYSEVNIMKKMTEVYSLDDFKATKLYASIKKWQDAEGVCTLLA